MELKLGEKVRIRRKQLGLTLKELAGDRVTAAQISAIEKGKCNPSSGLLSYIAERLMVEPEYFLLTDDERSRKKFQTIKKESERYFLQGDYKTARECMEKAKGMLESLTDGQKGFYYGLIGNCMYENKDFENAFDIYIKAIAYYNKAREVKEILGIYFKSGTCLTEMGKYAVAMGYYKTVIFCGEKEKSRDIMERSLHNMSLCCTSLQRHEEASYYICELEKRIVDEDEKVKDVYYPGITMLRGIINYNQRKYEEALEYFDKSMQIYRNKRDKMGLGRAQNNYGQCLADLGRTQEALDFFSTAVEYKRQNDDPSLVETYLSIANIYERQGDWNKALETVCGAEEYILAKDMTEQAGPILRAKFRYLLEVGDYDKAEIFAFLALDCIQRAHDTKEEARLYILISKMYEKMGDEKNTLTYLVKANKLM